jgi:hypothetical protein
LDKRHIEVDLIDRYKGMSPAEAQPAWSVPLKSSNDSLDSTAPVNTDREQLLRELANEFGYELMSRVANYSFINRLGTFDPEGKLIPDSDF